MIPELGWVRLGVQATVTQMPKVCTEVLGLDSEPIVRGGEHCWGRGGGGAAWWDELTLEPFPSPS